MESTYCVCETVCVVWLGWQWLTLLLHIHTHVDYYCTGMYVCSWECSIFVEHNTRPVYPAQVSAVFRQDRVNNSLPIPLPPLSPSLPDSRSSVFVTRTVPTDADAHDSSQSSPGIQ